MLIGHALPALSRGNGLSSNSGLAETTYATSEGGWAVLLEMNEFPEGWSDLPVEFINSERLQTALLNFGWRSDHIFTVHDNLTISVVQEAM